jgi:hypothetical protein
VDGAETKETPMSRDYPILPAPTSCDDDPAHEPLDAKTMRERLAAREAATERFRGLKEKLLAERDAKRGRG